MGAGDGGYGREAGRKAGRGGCGRDDITRRSHNEETVCTEGVRDALGERRSL